MQVNYQQVPQNTNQANAMSDHHAQVYPEAGMVCQNLQGPYAIKKNSEGFWTFDCPNESKVIQKTNNTEYYPQFNIQRTMLEKLSGMDTADSERLLEAMINDNENNAKKIPSNQTDTILASLKNRWPGIGEGLGAGNNRISIESNAQYKIRIEQQIIHLKNSLQPEAAVLMFQEQPYQLKKDEKRLKIFQDLMLEHGYQCKASIPGRDVGIWVKSNFANSFKKPHDPELVSMIEGSPFRGCVTQGLDTLYINLHCYTFEMSSFNDYITKLCELSKVVNQYAKNRKLKICLNGDLNLYGPSLKLYHKGSLMNDAGFTLTPAKGQAGYPRPTQEGYINKIDYYLQRQDIPTPTPNYVKMQSYLIDSWNYVEKSLGNNISIVESIAEYCLPNFSNFKNIPTITLYTLPFDEVSVSNLYQKIHRVLGTKTARFMTSPQLHDALVKFKNDAIAAFAITTPPDNETHAILEGILDEFKKFISNRTKDHTEKDKHDGLVEIYNALNNVQAAPSPYRGTVNSFLNITNTCRNRLNHNLNFFHQMTRNKDVADVYDLFNDNSLLTIENDQVKYNTKGLDTILIKLESLNRNFDREKAHNTSLRNH